MRHEKIASIFQNLIYNDINIEKHEVLLKETLPPENLDGLEPTRVNTVIWGKIAHQTKRFDLKLQNLQMLVLKSLSILSTTANKLYENRSENDLTKLISLIKSTIKCCADSAVFLGKANEDILTYRREKINLT